MSVDISQVEILLSNFINGLRIEQARIVEIFNIKKEKIIRKAMNFFIYYFSLGNL